MTDWRSRNKPADTIKGGLCCSATYDLAALRLSSGGSRLSISDATEDAMSAGRRIDRLSGPVIVAVGSLETSWFRRRTAEFASEAQASRKSVRQIVVDGYNHFEVIETLANPYSELGRAALEQMRL